MPATRQQVVDAAREWKGTRWRHQGRKKGVVSDCIGLVIGVADELDLWDFDHRRDRRHLAYGRRPEPSRMKESMETFFTPILLTEAGKGDILWLRVEDQPMHVGILNGEGGIIHGWWEVGFVCEQSLREWSGRMQAAFRYPKLID